MKSWILNIVLIGSFVAAVAIYYIKDKRTHNSLDYVSASLQGLKNILPANAHINYKGIGSDPVNYWETFHSARYFLVPAFVSTSLQSDTVLTICRLDADTASQFMSPNARVLWEHKDTVYHYI